MTSVSLHYGREWLGVKQFLVEDTPNKFRAALTTGIFGSTDQGVVERVVQKQRYASAPPSSPDVLYVEARQGAVRIQPIAYKLIRGGVERLRGV